MTKTTNLNTANDISFLTNAKLNFFSLYDSLCSQSQNALESVSQKGPFWGGGILATALSVCAAYVLYKPNTANVPKPAIAPEFKGRDTHGS